MSYRGNIERITGVAPLLLRTSFGEVLLERGSGTSVGDAARFRVWSDVGGLGGVAGR